MTAAPAHKRRRRVALARRHTALALAASALLAWPSTGQTPPATPAAPDAPVPLLPDAGPPPPSSEADMIATPAAPPPADAAAAAGDLNAAPDAAFDLPGATGRTVDVAGPLTEALGGYGTGTFANSNARFVAALMQRMQGPVASRWAHIVLRRALLSESSTPSGANPADWIAWRALLLTRLGEVDGAKALVDFVPPDRFTPLLYRVAGQVHFAAADPPGICPLASTGIAVSRDPLWRLSEAMCAAMTGDDVTAARTFDALHEKGDVDLFDVRLGERVAALAGGGGRATNLQWDEVAGLTPYRFGIAAASGVALPPPLLARFVTTTQGASIGWVWRAGALPADVRAAAMRPAAAMGIVSAAEMVALRSAEGDSPAAAVLRRAYASASSADRATALRQIWASGDTADDHYAAHVETALACATLRPERGLAADAPDVIASLLSAGLSADASRWAAVANGGDAAQRGQAWAQLAPIGAVAVTPKAFNDWLESGSDKAVQRHRAGLLLAALDALGRTRGDAGWDAVRRDLIGEPAANSWTRAIDAAAAAQRIGEVAVLAGTGLQSAWGAVPPAQLGHIIAAYVRVGRVAEAQLLAAEAVARG